jgi:murein DD-endopeptidase MepM/ murein hydrolase activator NlpD
VDIRAYLNDPIYSTEAGVVEKIVTGTVGASGRYGYVNVRNSSGSLSHYGHIGALDSLVVGAALSAGQQIGTSMSYGTGAAHLHYAYFEVRNGVLPTFSPSNSLTLPLPATDWRVDPIANQLSR